MTVPLLRDRVVLISGGTQGLGAGIARTPARGRVGRVCGTIVSGYGAGYVRPGLLAV